jgi:N-acetylglucosaminyldiphosphoundecaprenol N-acetyl-beta-D-mannosaminyltransferase
MGDGREAVIDRGKQNLLGVAVDAVDYEAAVDRIIQSATVGQRCTTAALAVHGVMTGVLDPEHRYRLNNLDLVVPDGQPVRWAINLLYRTGLPDRVYGPTLALKVCEAAAANGLPVYFYGSRLAVVKRLVENLSERFDGLRIAGFQPSRFRTISQYERDEIVRDIFETGAKITFVGLGCPRQEVWAYEFGDRLGMPTIAVGAAFDFHAGYLKQAPSILQRFGLEWAFRLLMEPKRLWRRYLILNPYFTMLVVLQLTGRRRFNVDDVRAPALEKLIG